MAASLQLVISALDKASGPLRDIDKSVGGLSKTAGTVLRAGFVAGAAGIGIATFAGIKFVKAAMEEEAGIRRLAAAVDASGGSWAKSGKAIEDAIKQREKLAFSDNDLRSSLAVLTAITGDSDEALRRQSVAMDLARGAGIDLGSASKLLGKVTDESHAALSRMGITLDKNASATDVLAAVQQKFGGQAAAFADSAAGKWAQFGNQMQNLKEVIGAALLPVVTLLGGALVDLVTLAIPKVEELAKKLVEWVTPAVTQGIDTLKGKFQDFQDTLVIISQSSVFKGFLDGVNEGLGNIRDVAIDAKDVLIDAFGKIDELLRNVPGLDKLTKGMGDASKDAEGAKNVGKLFTEAAAGIIAFSIATSTLDTSINIIGNSMGALAGVMTTGMAIFLAPNPFLLFLAAVALIVAALVAIELKTKFFSKDLYPVLRDDVVPVLQDVGGQFQKIAEFWAPLLADALVTLRQGWEDIRPAIEPTIEFMGSVLGPVFEKIGGFLKEHPLLITLAVAAIVLLVAPWLLVLGTLVIVLAKWDEIKAMFTVTIPAAIDSTIGKIEELPVIGEIFKGVMDVIVIIVTTGFANLITIVDTSLKVVRDIINIVAALIRGDWSAALDGWKQLLSDFWGGVLSIVVTNLSALRDLIFNQLSVIAGIIGDTWRPLGNTLRSPFDDARDAINWVIRRVEVLIDTINRIPSPRDIVPNINLPNLPGVNPFRALGGPVKAATAYIVGEKGPEWFVPKSAGNIVPNAGGGTTYITVPITFAPMVGDATPAQAELLADMVERALRKRL